MIPIMTILRKCPLNDTAHDSAIHLLTIIDEKSIISLRHRTVTSYLKFKHCRPLAAFQLDIYKLYSHVRSGEPLSGNVTRV